LIFGGWAGIKPLHFAALPVKMQREKHYISALAEFNKPRGEEYPGEGSVDRAGGLGHLLISENC